MPFDVLDPTHETDTADFRSATRLASLSGATVALVSNGKKGVRPFFDAFERSLRTEFGVVDVVRLTKSNYSAPAEETLLRGAETWNALVAGVGD